VVLDLVGKKLIPMNQGDRLGSKVLELIAQSPEGGNVPVLQKLPAWEV